MGDDNLVAALQRELDTKKHELALKQAELDAFRADLLTLEESSKEIEKELEDDIGKLEEKVEGLQKDLVRAREALEEANHRASEANSEVVKLTKEVVDLKGKVGGLESVKRSLETANDTLEQKVRVLEAAEEALRYKVEGLMEEKVFQQHELEDATVAFQETEARLRQELSDVKSDLQVMRMSAAPPIPNTQPEEDTAAVRAAEEQLEHAKRRQEELEALVSSLQSRLQDEEINAEASLAKAKEEADAIQQEAQRQREQLEAEVASLRTRLDEAEALVIESVSEAGEEAVRKQDELEAELTTMRWRLGDAEAQVKTLQAELELAVKERAEASEMCRGLQSERDEWAGRVSELEAELKGFEEQILEDTNLMAQQEAKIQELTEQADSLRSAATTPSTAAPSPLILPSAATGFSPTSPRSPRAPSDREVELANKVSELESMLLDFRRKSLMAASHKPPPLTPARLEADQPLSAKSAAIEKAISCGDMRALSEEVRYAVERYRQQRAINARILSRMGALQSRIQVCCRIRPLNDTEVTSDGRVVVEALSECEVGFNDRRAGYGNTGWRSFAFDRVWGPQESQEEVFMDVEPLALAVVDGLQACIMAYGQTGSGKTHTMQGSSEGNGHGISFRVLHKMLQLIALRKEAMRAEDDGEEAQLDYSVKVAMVEVYNDDVRDLLASPIESGRNGEKVAPSLDIRRDTDGQLQLPGMAEEPIRTLDDVMSVIQRGNRNRATASTNIHDHSSRSHSIIIVTVTATLAGRDGRPSNAGAKSGCLYLVDLAGSERVKKSAVTGAELKEAQHINKSLSALGDVMEALDHKASYVPYRNSKLTYLLQDCLGGTARTLMIVTACPLDDNAEETLCTLTFASRVRSIQLSPNTSAVRAKNVEQELKALKSEARMLSAKKTQAEEALASVRKELAAVQKKAGSAIEARSRSETEARRALEDMVSVLKTQKDELGLKLQQERSAKDKAAAELAETQKQLRRLQVQVEGRSVANADLLGSLATRDGEIQELRRQLRALKAAALQQSSTGSVPLTATISPVLLATQQPSAKEKLGTTTRSQHPHHRHASVESGSVGSVSSLGSIEHASMQASEATAAGEPNQARTAARRRPAPPTAADRSRLGLTDSLATTTASHKGMSTRPLSSRSVDHGFSTTMATGDVEYGEEHSPSLSSTRRPTTAPQKVVGRPPGLGGSILPPRPRLGIKSKPPAESKDGKPLWR